MTSYSAFAANITKQWGPFFTKSVVSKDVSEFAVLFELSEPVQVVLQNGEGAEATFTIGYQEEADLTWAKF